MAGVENPVDRGLARALRRAVLDHAGSEQRRLHPPVLHVGVPGGFPGGFPGGVPGAVPGAAVARLDLGATAGPVDPGLAVDVVAAMRARVRRAAEGDGVRRRMWATVCRAGAPSAELDDGPDDLDYAGAPAGGPEVDLAPFVWLTRAGDPALLQDLDAHWLAAAGAAYAEAGAALTFVVVGRRGWYDPRSGVGRTWVRLRQPVR
ncbi:hypothetical protein [Nocardioides flavescens]|uniref:Uncharacterized protein n=1 Tax=Nocardioides flavescens TaxID=2691959 RepID=A0A6L7EWZ1_9ACTN|nr:hypothetical protein [Nocardioides flavescens]